MALASILLPSGVYLPAAASYSQDSHTVFPEQTAHAMPPATTDSFTGNLQTKCLTDVQGYSSATIAISGTYAGVQFQVVGYNDGTGTTGGAMPFRDLGHGGVVMTGRQSSNSTRFYQVDVAGLTHIALLSVTYTSGTANLRVQPSAAVTAGTSGGGTPQDTIRRAYSLYANAVAAGTTTTETAITLTRSTGTAATSTATSFAPSATGKIRINAISFATRGHATATAQTTTFNLRINTAGSVTTTSTPVVISAVSATAAVSLDWDRVIVPIPEGFEIIGDGTLSFGVTAAATYTTNAPTWYVNILGWEVQ